VVFYDYKVGAHTDMRLNKILQKDVDTVSLSEIERSLQKKIDQNEKTIVFIFRM
jgi:hypothetical protein